MVNGNTRESRSVVVASGVIFPIFASIEDGVHEEMGHSVGERRNDVAKPTVYLPHSQSLGDFLVACSVVVMLIEVLVSGITIRIHAVEASVVIHLSERLGFGTQGREGKT